MARQTQGRQQKDKMPYYKNKERYVSGFIIRESIFKFFLLLRAEIFCIYSILHFFLSFGTIKKGKNCKAREGIMGKGMFIIKGNICAERVRLGRALHKPPLTQEELARKIQFMGSDMTKVILSRIEKNERHVCDAELRAIAQALDVSMEWLVGDANVFEKYGE